MKPVTGKPTFSAFPSDAPAGRFEITFRLPADLEHGAHQIELRQGARTFPSVAIEVV